MTDRTRNQLNRSWIALLLAALASMAVVMLGGRVPAVVAVVLAVAIFKSRLIVLDFMGLRSAPAALRLGLLAWSVFFALAAVAKHFATGTLGG